MISYIIASYSGAEHTSNRDLAPNVLDLHIQELIKLFELQRQFDIEFLIKEILIICPKPKTMRVYSNYYQFDKWANQLSYYNIHLRRIKYSGENKHHSYDQWIQGCYCAKYDYCILIEDDYCPNALNEHCIHRLKEIYDYECPLLQGFLSSCVFNNHFGLHSAISNGMIHKNTFKIIPNFLDELYELKGNTQVNFSRLFLKYSLPLKDYREYAPVLFWSSGDNMIQDFSLINEPSSIFIPIQALSHEHRAHCIYIIGEWNDSLLDKISELSELNEINESDIYVCTLYKQKVESTQFKLKHTTCLQFPPQKACLSELNQETIRKIYKEDCIKHCIQLHPTIKYNKTTILNDECVKINSDDSNSNDSIPISYKTIDLNNFNPSTINFSHDTPIILIPSVINIIQKSRSRFNREQRFQQTLRQVRTLREFIPNAIIILLETSILNSYEIIQLSQFTNVILFFTNDTHCQMLAHQDLNKNKTEVYLMIQMMNFFTTRNIPYSHLAKFGGRYWVTDKVDQSVLFQSKPVMKKVYMPHIRRNTIVSIFFSIPFSETQQLLDCFRGMEIILNHSFTDVEQLLWDLYASKVPYISPEIFEIQGFPAVYNIFSYF